MAHRDDERLADWLDGRMGERERERFEAELRVNAELREAAEEYRGWTERIRGALREDPVPGVELTDRIMGAVDGASTGPRLLPWLGSVAAAAALVLVYFGLQRWGGPRDGDRNGVELARSDFDADDRQDSEQATGRAERVDAESSARSYRGPEDRIPTVETITLAREDLLESSDVDLSITKESVVLPSASGGPATGGGGGGARGGPDYDLVGGGAPVAGSKDQAAQGVGQVSAGDSGVADPRRSESHEAEKRELAKLIKSQAQNEVIEQLDEVSRSVKTVRREMELGQPTNKVDRLDAPESKSAATRAAEPEFEKVEREGGEKDGLADELAVVEQLLRFGADARASDRFALNVESIPVVVVELPADLVMSDSRAARRARSERAEPSGTSSASFGLRFARAPIESTRWRVERPELRLASPDMRVIGDRSRMRQRSNERLESRARAKRGADKSAPSPASPRRNPEQNRAGGAGSESSRYTWQAVDQVFELKGTPEQVGEYVRKLADLTRQNRGTVKAQRATPQSVARFSLMSGLAAERDVQPESESRKLLDRNAARRGQRSAKKAKPSGEAVAQRVLIVIRRR